MNNNNNNNSNSASKDMMNRMKHDVANQLGINLKQGYNGDLTSKEAGYIGGTMVKRMIEDVEKRNSNR